MFDRNFFSSSTNFKFPNEIILKNEGCERITSSEIIDAHDKLEKEFISKLVSRADIVFDNKLEIPNNGILLIFNNLTLSYRLYVAFKLNGEIFNEHIDIERRKFDDCLRDKDYELLRNLVLQKLSDILARKLLSRIVIKLH